MAVITNFGVPAGSDAGTTLMPKLQYRFRVSFTGLGDGNLKSETTQNVISASRPNLTHEEVVVDSYNSKMYLISQGAITNTSMFSFGNLYIVYHYKDEYI